MMKSKIIWLRISYWIAAIADFAIALSVLIPERVGLSEFVYPKQGYSRILLYLNNITFNQRRQQSDTEVLRNRTEPTKKAPGNSMAKNWKT